MEEKKLVLLSRDGQESAFAALVNKYRRKVFHMAYSATLDRDTADDLTQEIFIKTYFALPKYRFQSAFGTWLYRIATNHIYDYIRKTKKKFKNLSLESLKIPVPDTMWQQDKEKQERESCRILIHSALKKLPPKHQLILLLIDVQDLSYEETARILNISPGTVGSRLHRARKMLRRRVEPLLISKGESDEM